MSAASTSGSDPQKRAAAAHAAALVTPDMVLGLGSGSTAELVLEALAARVAQGLRIVGIPTSQRTETRARQLGLTLTDFAAHRRIDLTLDGADEVERGTLNLIKGRGGALLREKIVAAASARMVAVVDETKLVDRLGAHVPLPVEIIPFGWQVTLERLTASGAAPTLRQVEGKPFVTDSGNYIADCAFPAIADPATLQAQLATTTGVVESGLFIGLARAVVIGGRSGGVEILER
jgi:ribose 5-phosphate isomerase A